MRIFKLVEGAKHKKLGEACGYCDPDHDEMLAFLRQGGSGMMDDEDLANESEVAIYWFANFYHGGQGSDLYRALSTSPYRPGPNSTLESEGDTVQDLYQMLVDEYMPHDRAPDDRQLGESREVSNLSRLTAKERKKISDALHKNKLFGGNLHIPEPREAISPLAEALRSVGFTLDMVSGDLILGPKGSRHLSFRHTHDRDFEEHPQIENSYVNFVWEELSPASYEILAYLT